MKNQTIHGIFAKMYNRSSKVKETYITYRAAIADSSEGAIFSKWLKANTITWNTGYKIMFGHKANEAIGYSMKMHISESVWNVEKLLQE
ncbi:MAG: PAS domain S-box protein [Ferruginibacter sp.]|nr:PAS domain S-box protein [Ferruginibacter sp.]